MVAPAVQPAAQRDRLPNVVFSEFTAPVRSFHPVKPRIVNDMSFA